MRASGDRRPDAMRAWRRYSRAQQSSSRRRISWPAKGRWLPATAARPGSIPALSAAPSEPCHPRRIGELCLHLGLQQPVDGHRMTLGHRHVVNEHFEVGSVHSVGSGRRLRGNPIPTGHRRRTGSPRRTAEWRRRFRRRLVPVNSRTGSHATPVIRAWSSRSRPFQVTT